MRLLGTAALLAALLTGCGLVEDATDRAGGADDVPTITTRPSTLPSTTPTTSTVTDGTAGTSEPPSLATSTPPTTSGSPTETAGPSPEPPTDRPVGPRTYDQAVARIDEIGTSAGQPVTSGRFATPGDVVYCLLEDPVIGPSCELRTGFVKDTEVCGSGVADGVGRVETFEGRARPVCNTDTIREPGAEEVGAPAVVNAGQGDVECAVERAGVTCVDRARRTGFFLGPGEYHVF